MAARRSAPVFKQRAIPGRYVGGAGALGVAGVEGLLAAGGGGALAGLRRPFTNANATDITGTATNAPATHG